MDLVTLALAKSYTDKEIQKAEMGDIQLDTGLGKSGYAADSAAVKQYVDEATSKIPNWILLHEQSGRKVQIADYSKNPIDIEKGQSITSNYGNSMSVLASFFAQCYQICSGGLDLNYEIFAKRLAEEGQILVDNNVFIGTSHKVSVSWNENPNCYKNITIDQTTYQGKRAWMISDLDRDGVLGARTIFILSDGSILSNDLLSTDTTLTERGIPADAKIVGDKIKIVESNIETNINQALTEAKESGEFDGPQGETGPSAIHVGVEAPENEDILVWINPENDDFSDFISTPPTAEVGQTIVVEEIDEKGKPIKWKAIDLPAGGSGGDKWETIIDYTVPEECSQVLLTMDLNGNPFSLKQAVVICLVYPLAEPAKWPLRCVFDAEKTGVYGAQHFWSGLPSSPDVAEKCAGFRLHVIKTNEGLSVLNSETTQNPVDIKEDGDFTMIVSNQYQRYNYKTLTPVATGITAFGVGSYKTAIGAGTRIKLLGVRE